MKRVTAFVGSARKKSTYNAVRQFLDNLQSLGDVEYEIVALSEYGLGTCRGCQLCFEKGEEFCPLKDDRDVLIEKIMASDGVVFASPNYSFQVSAIMKIRNIQGSAAICAAETKSPGRDRRPGLPGSTLWC